VVHFNVTEHPTEEWTAQQIREAFPWDQAPRYLIRDRDAIFGGAFVALTKSMGIEDAAADSAQLFPLLPDVAHTFSPSAVAPSRER